MITIAVWGWSSELGDESRGPLGGFVPIRDGSLWSGLHPHDAAGRPIPYEPGQSVIFLQPDEGNPECSGLGSGAIHH